MKDTVSAMKKRLLSAELANTLLFSKVGIGFLFFLCCSFGQGANGAYAQIKSGSKKADSYFENNEFARAIPLYKKEAEKNDEALVKLAACYRILKNYSEAELYYSKLASKSPSDPTVYYYYAEALLNNNKYEEAKEQFLLYSSLNPSDKRGALYAKACEQMKDILARPALYKIYNLGAVNSAVSDFCPVFYKEGIVFASERVQDLVNYSRNNYTGNAFVSLVYAKGHKKPINNPKDTVAKTGGDTAIFNKAVLLSEKFSGDGHYGPACFTPDFSEIYFTKVDNSISLRRNNTKIYKPKLYWSKYNGGWSSPKELPFNKEEYVTGHPSISADKQYLFFTSDMPGGEGGTDIWVSKREGDTWGAPKNLGSEINTAGNETFPYINPDNTLYFSSSGHAGFGGLDLFASVQKDGNWTKASNMMPPVNSSGDDFGIVFKDDHSGYFSSNRAGGMGSDDLYGFSLSGKITSISGKILLSTKTNDGAQNLKVFLLTADGTILQTTFTDGSGFFRFENLMADENYTVRVDETDPSLVNQKRFYLSDAKNKVVRMIVKGKDDIFIFENLPPDLSKLSELNEEDVLLKKISIAGNLYAGEQRSPIENSKVNLVNSKGEIVQSTTTNAFGSFVFMNISPDENFTVLLDESDPTLASQKIYFTNKSGKEISMSKGGGFKFQILATDTNSLSLLKVEDSQLLIDLKGALYADKEGKNRLVNAYINLIDDKGNIAGSSKTDAAGGFKFLNLAADKNYMVRLKEDDPTLNSKAVFLADAGGRIVATLKSASGSFFRYTFLPLDEQSLGSIYFDDPWLQVAKANSDTYKDSTKIIIENIYFEYQKSDLMPQAIITLNKVIEVMKTNEGILIDILSYTDSRGTEDFNARLSQKRSQTAVDYMIAKGIDKQRLTPIGKGETRILNKCKDGIDCSEDEHAQNRRTEFNVKNKTK